MERVLTRDACCIDVGCHFGSILREMLRIAPEGRHHAFEPLPALHRQLVENFPAVIHRLALSDTRGQTTFQYVVSNPGYSGLLRRTYEREDETVVQITVETDLLDNVVPASLPVRLIKIDVEGAELQVLRGGVKLLKRHRPFIIFEHGLGAADHYGTTPEEVYDLLSGDCGLEVNLMARWLNGAPPLSRDAFSTFFRDGTEFYFMAGIPNSNPQAE